MKIKKERIKFITTDKDIMPILAMIDFTNSFAIENSRCVDYDCEECPLRTFCGTDLQGVMLKIENFLNNEI